MPDPSNKVPFPLAGEGAHLRYRTGDMVELRNKYGEPKLVTVKDPNGFNVEVFETFTDRLDTLVRLRDPVAILDCLKHGLKHQDGVKAWTKIDYNDLPFGLGEVVEPIQSAIVLGITGESYATLLRKQLDAEAEAAKKKAMRDRGIEFNDDDPADPQMTLTEKTSSPEPSGSDIAPDS